MRVSGANMSYAAPKISDVAADTAETTSTPPTRSLPLSLQMLYAYGYSPANGAKRHSIS